MSAPRLAWLSVMEGRLVIGDPGREHVVLDDRGVVVTTPTSDPGACRRRDWAEVDELHVVADTTRVRHSGRWALLRAAILEAIGWGSDLPSADVRVRLGEADGGEAVLLLDGFPGRAYFVDDHEEAIVRLGRAVAGWKAGEAVDVAGLLKGR